MGHITLSERSNQYHWSEAFNKFGYDDGDGDVQSPLVAKVLEDAGYSVKY